KFRGGMTFEEIAAALAVHPASIGQAWRRLELPARSQFKRSPREKHHHDYARRRERHLEDVRLWKERNPERARAIRKRGSARWLARVLREEAGVAPMTTIGRPSLSAGRWEGSRTGSSAMPPTDGAQGCTLCVSGAFVRALRFWTAATLTPVGS